MLYNDDCFNVLKKLDSNSIDAIVTDPPYGYSFMNKNWDKVIVSVSIWKECLRVLKPGSFACVMSSPRQDVLSHMIVNLDKAGFNTNFTSIYWTYASGFPKAANVSKLVDKRLGFERQVISGTSKPYEYSGKFDQRSSSTRPKYENALSEQAKALDGSYAGFQPKPAVEVILIVMKPLSEKSYVDQALSNGKGVTWLDDCRIPYDSTPSNISRQNRQRKEVNIYGMEKGIPQCDLEINLNGRFPANLLVSDDMLNDGQVRKVGKIEPHHNIDSEQFPNTYGDYKRLSASHQISYGDSGSYSRFFDLDKWFDTTFPFLIIPKPVISERNRGLDRFLGKKVNDGRKTEIDNPFQRGETLRQNTHPTVKPLKLMSYLITLVSRKKDTVLDPFMGSGSTIISSILTDRNYIGIELQKEYYDIAEARINKIEKKHKEQIKITDLILDM